MAAPPELVTPDEVAAFFGKLDTFHASLPANEQRMLEEMARVAFAQPIDVEGFSSNNGSFWNSVRSGAEQGVVKQMKVDAVVSGLGAFTKGFVAGTEAGKGATPY